MAGHESDGADFRRTWHPEITWTSTVLSPQNGVYIADPPMPGSGATAYFIEFTYPSDLPGFPHKFTTDIWVKSTLPLFEWPFESGFPEPSVAVATAQAAVASALAIEADASPADEANAAPLAATVAEHGASPSAAAQVAAAVTNGATADASGTDLGDGEDLVDALFADTSFENELEELLV